MPLNAAFFLRTLGLVLNLQGEYGAAKVYMQMADAADAGRNIDAHMQAIADNLKAGVAPNWDDVLRRINEKTDSILGA